jgi:vitamin B12 transporter
MRYRGRSTRFRGATLLGCLALFEAAPGSAAESDSARDEVVVEGQGPEARDPTAATTVIQGAHLHEPSPTAAEVVEQAPGVQVTRTGTVASLSTLSVRGSDASQVAVFFGGIRIQDELTGVSDLSRIPVWAVERVEVVRGTTPLDAPGRALAGAVFFEPRVTERPAALVGTSVGSYGTVSGYGLFSVASPPPQNADARAVRVHTSLSLRLDQGDGNFVYRDDGETAFDPSDDQRRVRQNSDYRGFDMLGLSRLSGGSVTRPWKVDLLLGALHRNQGVSSLSATPALFARLTSTRELLGVVFDQHFSPRLSLKAKASVTRQLDDFLDPRGELGFGVPELEASSLRTTGSLNVRTRPVSSLGFGLSLHGEFARLVRYSAAPDLANGQEGILSARADAAWNTTGFDTIAFVEALCVGATGQAEGKETRTEDCAPEARLGSSVELVPGLSLKANVGYGVRAPTLGERFGMTATTRGRPGLKFEKGPGGDLGLVLQKAGRAGRLSLELFGFARAAQDLIVFERSSLGYVRPQNIGSGRFLGVETALRAQAPRFVRFDAAFTAQDPRNTSSDRVEGNTLLPYRSQLLGHAELELYLEPLKSWITRVGSFLSLNYRSGRVLDPAGLLVLPEQATWDVGARYEFFEGRLRAQAQVQNLFDAARFDLLGYPLPGRTVELGLELRP